MRPEPIRAVDGPGGGMRLVAGFLGWWIVLFGLYGGLIASRPWPELLLGAALAAASAGVAIVAARAFGTGHRIPRFVLGVLWLPIDLARDTVLLVRLLVRMLARLLVTGRGLAQDPGRTDHLSLDGDPATTAWAILLVSAAPGSLAVGLEPGRGRARLERHSLTSGSRSTRRLDP